MSKQKRTKLDGSKNATVKPTTKTTDKGSAKRHLPLLPIPLIVFFLVWAWAALWQGDVFRMVREQSFFAPNELLMEYELQQSYGVLWTIGRALLMSFRYTWLGGALLAFLLTSSCWMLGYAMRLKAGWRWIQYLPLGIYIGIFTYQGLGNYFEAETGQAFGIPFCIFLILAIWGVMIRSFSHKPTPTIVRRPTDEDARQNYTQLLVALLMIIAPSVWGQVERPYVRPIAGMQVATMNQDWQRVKDLAHANDELSNRPQAAYYAIALVQTGQICDKMFDIRLDYDSIYCPGYNGDHNPTNLYLMDCDYYAGLAQTAYHHAMEHMSMYGPTIRNMKMMTKVALLRGEWELADKYLTILDKVPFEGDFVEKYSAMNRDSSAIDADPEFKMVRLTEPINDSFENIYVQPVFLGYNARLYEGRSVNALWNSLMVNIYTKTMQDFIFRCQPLAGSTPPTSIGEALTLMSSKQPQLMQMYSGLNMHTTRLMNFLTDTKQYMGSHESRAEHARELYPKYKGYYPYYYFFGNLKATRRSDTKKQSSNAGVN